MFVYSAYCPFLLFLKRRQSMDDVIKSIIDIDRGAEEKLRNAEKEKLRIITDAKKAEEKMIGDALSEAQREIKEIENRQLSEANAKISALNEEKDRRISQMKHTFAECSEKWQDEIFKAVISV